ncbi:MAG: hypothetical protein FWH07_01665 [Oscillospiraceae bacterium]|nr:hypothetical protein [Oscillospiraceae bacterium]
MGRLCVNAEIETFIISLCRKGKDKRLGKLCVNAEIETFIISLCRKGKGKRYERA